MDLHVFLAVLAAAALHAGWNALIKGSGDPFLTTAHMSMCVLLAITPLLLMVSVPIAAAWPWLVASAILHAAYRFSLIATYRAGDLAQVYPMARGAAPLATAVVTLALIGEALGWTGYLGIACLASGVAMLSLRGDRLGNLDARAAGLALLTALLISAYTFVDGFGARVAGSSASFALYMFVMSAATALPLQMGLRGREILASFRAGWRLSLGAVLMSEAAYFIAIWAMTRAPIVLVAALRETSVLFATLIAVVYLKEPATRWRIGAGPLVVAGVVLMRLG
jgi:drug/metabolite transporter (DMT)-like permease